MDMGIDNKPNAHPGLVGHAQIRSDLIQWVDDGASCVPAAAEQVRDGHRIGVEELTQNHFWPPPSRRLRLDRRRYIQSFCGMISKRDRDVNPWS
jgi:hypothetical protein